MLSIICHCDYCSYQGSTAVCCDEAMKLITCLGILACTYLIKKKRTDGGGGYSQLKMVTSDEEEEENDQYNGDKDIGNAEATSHNQESFVSYLREELQFDFRMGGLALLYTMQKNLLYVAVSNLDAAVFQVTYQAKILTTALFSVLLLKRKLSCQKIVGLMILTMGVAVVQLDKVEENASQSYQEQNRWMGVLAVLGACCTSGFGGVYFELVLKPRQTDSNARPAPSVWAKNVQLSAFALIIALVTAFAKDHLAILSEGFFQGYSPLVVSVIALEAGGGLVVAAVIKYADNILKSFATAVSIVTSTIVSAWVFGFIISKLFVCGCFLVFIAIGLYSRKDEVERSSDTTEASQSTKRNLPMMGINSRKCSGLYDEESGTKA